jgi:branched-chain amino acid:cation transporter, LIVCS family
MNKLFKSETITIGLAMFSMFFGAGNIIFPLSVGQHTADKNFYAMLGLIITAVIVPIAGVISIILFDGNYRTFFNRLGKIPGFIISLIIISLLGPFGSTPRCIALSYSTLTASFLNLSPMLYSALVCGIIFLFTVRKNYLLTLLGWVLTPLLLSALITIIFMGFTVSKELQIINETNTYAFLHGLKEGYNTMDLLAAFFFSSTIFNILKNKLKNEEKNHVNIACRASIVGVFLLALIYIGFSYLAAFHGHNLTITGKDKLLAAITMKLAGTSAGSLVCITVSLACLTTAIALISAFTDFIHKEVFKEKINYRKILIWSLILTFLISTFNFQGISSFLEPILQICYPGLIALTIFNIAYCLINFKPVKLPVCLIFIISMYFYFF